MIFQILLIHILFTKTTSEFDGSNKLLGEAEENAVKDIATC